MSTPAFYAWNGKYGGDWKNYTHVLHQHYHKIDCSDAPISGAILPVAEFEGSDFYGSAVPIPPISDCALLSSGAGNSGTTYYKAWFANTTTAALNKVTNPFLLTNSSRTVKNIGYPVAKLVGGVASVNNTKCENADVKPYWHQYWVVNPDYCFYYFADVAQYFDNQVPNCNAIAPATFALSGTTLTASYRNYNATSGTCSGQFRDETFGKYNASVFTSGCTTGFADCYDQSLSKTNTFYRVFSIEDLPSTTTTTTTTTFKPSSSIRSVGVSGIIVSLALAVFLF